MKNRKTKTLRIVLAVLLIVSTLMIAVACGEKAPDPTPTPSAAATPTPTAANTPDETTDPAASADPAQALLDAAEETKEGFLAMIADPGAVTIVELEALVLARGLYEADPDRLDIPWDCPAYEAYSEILNNDEYVLPEYEERQALVMKLLTHPSALVRSYCIGQMGSMFGRSDEHINAVAELLTTDKDPVVIKAALYTFMNDLATNETLGKLALEEYAVSDDARIRAAVAYSLGSSWNKSLEGAVEAIIVLLGDSDQSVRNSAASGAGSNADERLIEPLVAILNNPDDTDTHGKSLSAIIDMWYDYPFHENFSEAAYNATLDYLRKTPRNNDMPTWTGVGDMKYFSTSNFGAWKEKATYFKPDELCAILIEIALDPDAHSFARMNAVEVVAVHGTEANLNTIKAALDTIAEPTTGDTRAIEAVDKALAELTAVE